MSLLSFYHFKDIPMKRILRYAIAVFIVLTFVAYSNPANATTYVNGTVNIEDSYIKYYIIAASTFAGTATFTHMTFDTTNYNSWYTMEVNGSAGLALAFSKEYDSTTFTCSVGCTGSGSVWYQKNTGTIKWVSSDGIIVTAADFYLTYTRDIFTGVVTFAGGKHLQNCGAGTVNQPIHICSTSGGDQNEWPFGYFVDVALQSTDTFFYSKENNIWNLTVYKDASGVATKYFLYNAASAYITSETAFNKVSFNYTNTTVQGLIMNTTTNSGSFVLTTVDTGSIVLNPGLGGSPSGQISYNFNNATIGNTYGLNASISNSNFTAFTTYYIYGYDTSHNLINGFPIEFSAQTYNTSKFWTFNKSGSYNATLKYCGVLECFLGIRHDLDTASIYIPPASYVFSVTTNQANYQPGNTIKIIATNPSPNPAYLTAYGETGIIDSIAWNTLIPAGQSVGLTKVIPQNLPLGTYTLNLATTQAYNPIVAQAIFNISSPTNTTGILSVLWGENIYLLGRVGTVTTTSGVNISTLTITSPKGIISSYSFPNYSTNYTMTTLDEVGLWKARIVDSGNASNYSQQNTTITAGNPTDNETIVQCMAATTYACWDKRTYEQGQAYTISYRLPIVPLQTYFPYIIIYNPSGKEVYNQSINMSFDGNSNIYIGSISGSFTPQAQPGVYFVRLKASDLTNFLIKAESATEVTGRTAAVTATPSIQQNTNNLLTGNFITMILVMLAFAGVGLQLGGFMGSVLGFGSGFIVLSVLGIMPLWALYLFAILLIVAFAAFVGKVFTGNKGGSD